MIFVKLFLIIGLIYGVDCVIDWAVAIGTSASVSLAVTSGTSLASSLAGAPGYFVVCTIEVENWTRFPLVFPASHINGGQLKSSPVTVRPGVREAFIAHKTGHTATGSYGTASWLISSANRRAVVMWSCPFNFNHHSNWLAVGLTDSGILHHRDWFNQMYYRDSGYGLKFVRGEYYYYTKTISVNDGRFEVAGTMGTSHKAKARIIIRPLNETDLAPKLKQEYDKVVKK